MTLLTRRSFLFLLLLYTIASHVALCVPSSEKRHLMSRQQQEGSGDDAVTTGDYYYTQPSWEEGYGDDDDDGTASETGSNDGNSVAATPTPDPGSSGSTTDDGSMSTTAPASPEASSDDINSGWYSPTAGASSTMDDGQQQPSMSSNTESPTNDQTPSASETISDNNQPPSSSDPSIVPEAASATLSNEQQDTTTDIPPTSTIDPTVTTMSNDQVTPSSNNDITSTISFSVTSSTATPSLVLGSHECATDTRAVNGECPSDYFCNAATHACVQLLANGEQCYEDFQCSSSYCVDGKCNNEPSKQGSHLSGGQIAGVTIGSVAGAIVLIGGFMFCMKRRRHGGNNSSSRARKFEQIRAQDDAEADVNMVEQGNAGVRDSKYNMLASLMQRASGGGQTLAYGNVGAESAPPAAAAPPMSQEQSASHTMMAVPPINNHRESKIQEPVMDQCAYEAQQYYGSLATDMDQPSSPAANANAHHKSWMTTGSAIDPHVVERPPTTLVRDSTLNNLHAPLFHVTGPADPHTVPAGGEAHVPTIPPPPESSSDGGVAELDAFQSRRSSWLLKEIAERWRQGSSSGARSSAIVAPHGDSHPTPGAPLLDDGLGVPGKRSSSLSNASTSLHNPFRTSSLMSGSDNSTITPDHRRTDSMISTLRMPPLVREPDAWTVEDSMSLTSDPTTTTTTTSTLQHPQHPPSSS
ncbi:hypothetical protein K492DRAFT_240076 [Lichtheimia hyalospora FSU 10163]|nr:hypothetical protein K492DRAFT_240076 [Lichtheimia hyalospora FSU 10163]